MMKPEKTFNGGEALGESQQTKSAQQNDKVRRRMPTEAERATRFARAAVFVSAMTAFGTVMVDAVHEAMAVPSLPAAMFQQATYVELQEREAESLSEAENEAQKSQSEASQLKEHTVEASDYKIDAKPEPKLETKSEPLPQPEPEPMPDPILSDMDSPEPLSEQEPEPLVKPTIEPKPDIKPAPKPESKPKPQRASKPELNSQTPMGKKKPAKPKVSAQKKVVSVQGATSAVPPARDALPGDANRTGSLGLTEGRREGGMGAGVSGTTATSSDGNLKSKAIAEIIAIVEANKSYPRRARQTGQEGTVVLAVHVNASGMVERIEVLKKHVSVLLNRAAKSAAEPLVGAKTPLKSALTLEIPVKFELRR